MRLIRELERLDEHLDYLQHHVWVPFDPVQVDRLYQDFERTQTRFNKLYEAAERMFQDHPRVIDIGRAQYFREEEQEDLAWDYYTASQEENEDNIF